MKTAITISMIMLMLASGFIFFNYDRADGGMKILNDDDYKDIEYSNPTYIDGSQIIWKDSGEVTEKEIISRNEYNNIFEDYRGGDISREEAIKLMKNVNIEW